MCEVHARRREERAVAAAPSSCDKIASMPFNARVIQVLIASPGDVQDERRIVADVIHEWNSVNARERGVVLMPLRWETDTRPDFGLAPQAAINRQIVDQADMVIGVFWTRLGTPTEVAASGTAEELDRVGEAGKPVMLYFSRSPVDPELLDLDEYARLASFRKRTYPRGLVEKYRSPQEFRVTLSRQLAMQVRDIIQETAPVSQEVGFSQTPQLRLIVLQPDGAEVAGSALRATRIICTNEDDVPSPVSGDSSEKKTDARLVWLGGHVQAEGIDPEYYRKLIRWYQQTAMTVTFRLALVNDGGAAVHDLHLDTRFTSDVPKSSLSTTSSTRPQKSSSINFTFSGAWEASRGGRLESLGAGRWAFETEVGVVQVGRTLPWGPELSWQVPGSGSMVITSTVYSSDAPPFILESQVTVEVEERRMTFEQILEAVAEPVDDSTAIETLKDG